jgi:hypothetical protein
MEAMHMSDRITQPETSGGLPTHQSHMALQGGSAMTPTPSHNETARRAYEIYERRGRRPNQCEWNWGRAERELRAEAMAAAAAPTPPTNGSVSKYSELLNGKRPAADARLIEDVLSAPVRMSASASAPHQGPAIVRSAHLGIDRVPKLQ